jgi:putative PIN family toxin of toxin-antitoxin system
MRIVVDTNVFVSACIGGGASSRLIEACILDIVEPVMSPALFLEYEDVLARENIFRRSRLNQLQRNALFEIFLGKCQLARVYYRWRPNLRDEGDNHLVELAVASGASVIATSNVRDFTDADLRFEHIRIMTPEAVLKELDI